MKTEDKAHIQLICDRNNIRWLDDRESRINLIQAGNWNQLYSGSSYSSQLINRETGEVVDRVIYINPQDTEDLGLDSTPEEDEENEYFVALHELGHNMLGHHNHNQTDGTDLPQAEIERHEMEAWEWAFAHANYWPSDITVIRSLCALSTYTHADQFREMVKRAKANGETLECDCPNCKGGNLNFTDLIETLQKLAA